PNSTWSQRLQQLLIEFPDLQKLGINLSGMGAIEGWEQWDCKINRQ
ncbi:MAG: hypothetical protein RLZZ66_1273, partial [Pseudomonadota bacterium]